MNYCNLLLVLFGFSANFIHRNVEAKLHGEGILGGDHATEGQFKYQVSIRVGHINICGGGILSDKYVLTAAHCVIDYQGQFDKNQLEVVAATLDSDNLDRSAVNVMVEKVYVHKAYDPVRPKPLVPYNTIADIAVLKLRKGLGLSSNPNLRKLRLPEKIGNDYPEYVGEEAVVAGYGDNWVVLGRDKVTHAKIEVDSGSYYKLKFAETTVISKASCSEKLLTPVYDTHICARVTQRNPKIQEGVCNGDSGGPFVHNGVTVIGVVSVGPIGCAEDKNAGIYTKVSAYIPFIENAMKDVKTDDMRVGKWTVVKKYDFSYPRIVFSES